MRVGLDIGSTTIKCVVLNENDGILYSTYERHFSHILEKAKELLQRVEKEYIQGQAVKLAISGSAGMGLAESCGVPFVQEVFATRVAVNKLVPGTDCVIELGGEDAKILFLTNGTEVRMNGSCAGGTGAFIDQMATLLKMSADEMDKAAQKAERTYTIASRCGVFAKSDIQPLINQGARPEDVAASIYKAVVNQTIAGLAQGRPIQGRVLYLGGPLTFSKVLRQSFDEALKTTGICPENSLLFVAMGAAIYSDRAFRLGDVVERLENYSGKASYASQPPLFENQQEYEEFHARHAKASVPRANFDENCGPVHIGIDSGSTTIKMVVINEKKEVLYTSYQPNLGNPLPLIRDVIQGLYEAHPGLNIASVTTTGYGEELVKEALECDYGLVETVAHFTAAKYFMPDVDFIIDIGGQDMKCFKIEDGAISNIFLNEACSSGCGSFLQTFAEILGYSAEEFAKIGLMADMPVDLGSRCTVFMNSSVKQAQKDGASVANISAGLSISIIKNALYKVIRPSSKEAIGKHIVVQGGTFLNDCVLRAFEQEMGLEVVRPNIAGLMGAFGAALYALRRYHEKPHQTKLLNLQQLGEFVHTVKGMTCGLCNNHCHLTVNTFAGGKRFISGNRCERPITHMAPKDELNLYRQKLKLLQALPVNEKPTRGIMGIPMGLNMYELLPFWSGLLAHLGFKVVHSPIEDKTIYRRGQSTIPSDTVCYPAKLMHGHIKWLLEQGITNIFYPCMTYNVDEHGTENCYNCPVVAYYPEVLHANMRELSAENIHFFFDYLGLLHKKVLIKHLHEMFSRVYPDITKAQIKAAVEAAFAAYDAYEAQVKALGQEIITKARAEHRPIVVLAGRPYHIDPKVNHSIDRLITTMGAALVSEDAVSSHITPQELNTDLHVLNQWTYHSRLYAAAKYVTENPDMHMIQLVSFGCGCDAITADECRRILEEHGRIYTQIKIDDIDNLGAAKIRIRSLFSAAKLFDLDNN